jgi:hydrogenase maturation protease
MQNIVVIGIGNPLLSDDSVGLLTVSQLRTELAIDMPDVTFIERFSGGMELLDDLIGSDHVIIIDSVLDPAIPPGTAVEVYWDDILKAEQNTFAAAHGLNLPTVFRLGEKCGMPMPRQIEIIAIGGAEFTLFSEEPTDQVKKGVQTAVAMVTQKLYNLVSMSQMHNYSHDNCSW